MSLRKSQRIWRTCDPCQFLFGSTRRSDDNLVVINQCCSAAHRANLYEL